MSRKNSVGSIGDMPDTGEFSPEYLIPEIPSIKVESDDQHRERSRKMSSSSGITEQKTNWKSLVDAADELGKDTKKLYKCLKRRISSKKKNRETEVKVIHIVPDEDEHCKWACRSASSANSRTSTGTSSTASKDEDGIETVHDMDDEYNAFHGC